uniref:Uncharacterized protein n=1 Tax=Physcomitrium patens TaxID=3218 RepID=A0A2K1JYM6_PHYPA|nr:hypothetical protein PHYPA_013754 [Physcomitrium patens]
MDFQAQHPVLNRISSPRCDLGGRLEACDTLYTNVEYLTLNRSLEASDMALSHARDLVSKGMSRLEEEFRALLPFTGQY